MRRFWRLYDIYQNLISFLIFSCISHLSWEGPKRRKTFWQQCIHKKNKMTSQGHPTKRKNYKNERLFQSISHKLSYSQTYIYSWFLQPEGNINDLTGSLCLQELLQCYHEKRILQAQMPHFVCMIRKVALLQVHDIKLNNVHRKVIHVDWIYPSSVQSMQTFIIHRTYYWTDYTDFFLVIHHPTRRLCLYHPRDMQMLYFSCRLQIHMKLSSKLSYLW